MHLQEIRTQTHSGTISDKPARHDKPAGGMRPQGVLDPAGDLFPPLLIGNLIQTVQQEKKISALQQKIGKS